MHARHDISSSSSPESPCCSPAAACSVCSSASSASSPGFGLIVDAVHLRPGTGGAVPLELTVVGIAAQAGITARGFRDERRGAVRAR